MCSTIVPTMDLRIGDVILDSATTDTDHPLITLTVLGAPAPQWYAVNPDAPEEGRDFAVAEFPVERHAYGRVAPERITAGALSAQCVIARLDPLGHGWQVATDHHADER